MNMNGIVILAAGSSSRLGQPKQLLKYRNKSLIRHVTDEAISSAAGPVMVVIGANATQVAAELNDAEALVRINEEWSEGMASSIRHGVKEMLKAYPDTQSVILAVCDQPFVSAPLFTALLAQKLATGKGIIASAYEGTLGTPALFGRKYFDQLRSLHGQEGAKKLLKLNAADVSGISFDMGKIDVDTPEDYTSLPSASG